MPSASPEDLRRELYNVNKDLGFAKSLLNQYSESLKDRERQISALMRDLQETRDELARTRARMESETAGSAMSDLIAQDNESQSSLRKWSSHTRLQQRSRQRACMTFLSECSGALILGRPC